MKMALSSASAQLDCQLNADPKVDPNDNMWPLDEDDWQISDYWNQNAVEQFPVDGQQLPSSLDYAPESNIGQTEPNGFIGGCDLPNPEHFEIDPILSQVVFSFFPVTQESEG